MAYTQPSWPTCAAANLPESARPPRKTADPGAPSRYRSTSLTRADSSAAGVAEGAPAEGAPTEAAAAAAAAADAAAADAAVAVAAVAAEAVAVAVAVAVVIAETLRSVPTVAEIA